MWYCMLNELFHWFFSKAITFHLDRCLKVGGKFHIYYKYWSLLTSPSNRKCLFFQSLNVFCYIWFIVSRLWSSCFVKETLVYWLAYHQESKRLLSWWHYIIFVFVLICRKGLKLFMVKFMSWLFSIPTLKGPVIAKLNYIYCVKKP